METSSPIKKDEQVLSMDDSKFDEISLGVIAVFERLHQGINSQMRASRLPQIRGRYAELNTKVNPSLALASLNLDIHTAIEKILGKRPHDYKKIITNTRRAIFAFSFKRAGQEAHFELGRLEPMPTNPAMRRKVEAHSDIRGESLDDLILWTQDPRHADSENSADSKDGPIIMPRFLSPSQVQTLHLVEIPHAREVPTLEELIKRAVL